MELLCDPGLIMEGTLPAPLRQLRHSQGTVRNTMLDKQLDGALGLTGRADHRPLRVLLVGPSLRYLGGQAVQLERLRRALEASGAISAGFLPVDPDLTGWLAPLGRIKYLRTAARSLAYAWSLRESVPLYDVIHAYSASYWSFVLAPLPAMLAARRHGKRVLLNYHSGEAEDHLTRWEWLMRRALRWADCIVVPSGYLVDVFARFGFRAEVAPNFVEIEHVTYRRRAAVQPRFIVNRNHESLYRVADVISAFALIQTRHPDAQMIVAGHGSLSEQLRHQATALGLRHVRFTGPVRPEDMDGLYGESEIFLNGSAIDNVPLSILEAFAAGLPVVSTDAGGIPSLVHEGHTGLLVTVGDASGLADSACRLLDCPELALQLSDNARAEVLEHFTARAATARWVACYESLGREVEA